MGNKLCAPLLKKTYRHEDYPWHIRKDSHLLRLWAEIFKVHGDGEYMSWERISEDVVPINISCIEDTPTTVFQVTAYNRHVEKIFDVKITQPGTIICPATESFVHWRDSMTKYEWGLNFTTPADAKRFRDCCCNQSHKFSRKASSASSLRLSPPKRIRGKDRSISSPSSPVHNHRRTISSPHDLHSDHPPPGNYDITDKKEKAATIPRTQMEAEEDAQLFKPTGILKPPSTSSLYDNIGGNVQMRKSSGNDTRLAVNRKSMPAPASSHVSFVEDRILNNTRPASAINFAQQYFEDASARSSSVTFRSDTKSNNKRSTRNVENIQMETAFVGDISVEDLPKEHIDRIRVLAPKPIKALSPPQRKSSSSSPEWPSPPEPLTPLTPLNPEVNVDFDSDVLRRMLQSLPVSPEDTNGLSHTDSENNLAQQSENTQNKGKSQNGNSIATGGLHKANGQSAAFVTAETSSAFVTAETSKSKQTKLVEYELRLRDQCARQSYTRDSYPDSGIGGMAGDNTTVSEESIKNRPQGIEVGSTKSGSCGTSSQGSSSSGRHSDLVNQLSEGSDLKQYFSRELSDDDGAESDDSIHTMTEAESKISYKQFGAIRKAGWLVVKNWLVHRKRRLEHAPKRKWKRYWVCLKGTVLLFYDSNEQNSITEDSVPRHILVIEGGIAQAVPEHPKRDNIFSLSTAFGDAYLFQALSSTEVENWICAIHSACASSFARQHGKDNTLKLIKSEQHKLENNIDVDVKMKKMAELQLTVVTDPRSRQAIIKQIAQWEENLEKLYIEQYRLRCYISTLQGTELPNPKVLLSNASKTTKATLGKLGVFTVTSFHALVAARRPLVVPNIYGKGSHKGGMLSPRGDGTFKYNKNSVPVTNLDTSSVYKATDIDEVVAELYRDVPDGLSDNSMSEENALAESLSRISLPNQQTILVNVNKHTIIQDLLESVCGKRQLNIDDHYVRVKLPNTPPGVYTIPEPQEIIRKMKYESIEVCEKNVFQVDLVKSQNETEFGFAVEAELAQSFERDDELRLYVSNVLPSTIAMQAGLMVGDEILVINGKVVSELDMVYIENLLQTSQSLCCTIRSIHTQRSTPSQKSGDIDNMVCPPPPSQSRISEDTLGQLIVPSPAESASPSNKSTQSNSQSDISTNQIDALLSNAEQVTAICRTDMDPKLVESLQGTKPLSEAQKLRKVIMELIDTERAYVKDLEFLIERYLEPLKEETFLSTDDVDHLFGNIHEISQFQRQFLQSLEEAMQLEGDFLAIEDPKLFRRVLFSLGGSFLFYANHFKVYSSFCASHTRSQKILNPATDSNTALKEFLQARNPKQQHSATLESYLIKPIQRILKYPLLLQQLCNLTDEDTDEHYHLSEALKGMEAVAEHINEMQKIFEEYGSVFDELSKMFKEIHPHKKPVDLSVGELQMYGTVEWCNICDSLGKVKKNLDLENIVFVFRTGVVFLCRERIKRRKSKGNTKGTNADPCYEFHERFRTLIPVQEVQVQGGRVSDMDRHYWWDLIHCRSDKDGRPERVYQFCNSSVEAKSDFMKIIRQTIRESVRKMTLPQGSQPMKNNYAPYGGQRLQKLPSNIRTLSKLRKGSGKNSDIDRHSAEFEEKINVLESDDSAFRIRSRTVGDLNDMEENDDNCVCKPVSSEPQICHDTKSSCSSNSSLSSRASGSAAKLKQASGNPLTFSSNSIPQMEGSPVWKPRNESNMVIPKGPHLCVPSSAISSSLVNSVVLNNSILDPTKEIKDTEC